MMRPCVLALPLALAPMTLACKSDNEVVRQSVTDVFTQVPSNEVDILWVVDDSQSMAEEQAEVAARFDAFIAEIESTLLDFHLGVLTTDMSDTDTRAKLVGDPTYLSPDTPDYANLFRQRVQVGVSGSKQEEGIDAAYQALIEPMVSGYNAGFLREDATLTIIYLSDENDCTDRGALEGSEDYEAACYDEAQRLVDMKELIADYEGIKADRSHLSVNAIVGPLAEEGCATAKPGFRYLTMADEFRGIEGDICEDDYTAIMEELGGSVAGVLTSFQLSEPADEATLEVVVTQYDEPVPWTDETENVLVPPSETDGWTYDATYYILSFHGAAVPPRGSSISVTYEVGG